MEVRNVIFRTILQKLRWPDASFPDICVYPIVKHLDKSRNYRKKLSPKNCNVIFDCRRGLI